MGCFVARLPDHVARAVADDGRPNDAVGAALDVDLHEPFRLPLQDGAVVVLELCYSEKNKVVGRRRREDG